MKSPRGWSAGLASNAAILSFESGNVTVFHGGLRGFVYEIFFLAHHLKRTILLLFPNYKPAVNINILELAYIVCCGKYSWGWR